MSDGIAEMNKAMTHTDSDGREYVFVNGDGSGLCFGCAMYEDGGNKAECPSCEHKGLILKYKESPLATASAELAAQGKPLVADIKPVSDIDTEQVTDPAHYAKSYPQGIEVYQMIEVILEKLGGHLTPYDQWLFGNILKYRLRAGFKDDGNDGMQDLKKAMRCREMMSD